MLSTVTAVTGALGTVAALLAILWRGIRGLHRFVAAVADNTSAVAELAADLREHSATTTRHLDALDARVTRLEITP